MRTLDQVSTKVFCLFGMRVEPHYRMEAAEDVWLKTQNVVWLSFEQNVELAPLSELLF